MGRIPWSDPPLFGYLGRLFMALKGLSLSYNKDLQGDKEPLRKGIEETRDVPDVMEAALACVRPRPGKMRDAIDSGLFATDLADYLVEKGPPFREAHGLVAAVVAFAERSGRDMGSLTIEEFLSFHAVFGEDVKAVVDLARSVRQKNVRLDEPGHGQAAARKGEIMGRRRLSREDGRLFM